MAQPEFVPLLPSDRVRPSSRLSVPDHWEQDRPAELSSLRAPTGPGFGTTGPDLGFGLKLAKRVAGKAVLAEGERRDDAVMGCFVVGARRASIFHRAPVLHDMELAFTLWGFAPGAPPELVGYRRPLFAGVADDYYRQRALAGLVAEEALRLSPAEVSSGLASNWRRWLGAEVAGPVATQPQEAQRLQLLQQLQQRQRPGQQAQRR
jgi:hypothetical protein